MRQRRLHLQSVVENLSHSHNAHLSPTTGTQDLLAIPQDFITLSYNRPPRSAWANDDDSSGEEVKTSSHRFLVDNQSESTTRPEAHRVYQRHGTIAYGNPRLKQAHAALPMG